MRDLAGDHCVNHSEIILNLNPYDSNSVVAESTIIKTVTKACSRHTVKYSDIKYPFSEISPIFKLR